MRRSFPLAWLAAIAAFVAFPAGAQEQSARSEQPPTSCQLVLPEIDESGRRNEEGLRHQEALLAVCGERGIVLGPADQYRSFVSVADDILLVELIRFGHRKVFMLTVDEAGLPVVQDLTYSIARAAGLSPTSRIDDLELGFNQLPIDGEIAIMGRRISDSAGRVTLEALDHRVSARSLAAAGRERNRGRQASSETGGGGQ